MNARVKIPIPHNHWRPRPHQEKLWNYLASGGKRAVAIWHRRAGKDEVCLHHAAVSALTRPGNYWHCLPEFSMGRKAIWDAVNPHTGIRRIDEAFPLPMRATTRDNDMHLRMVNGSTWQVVGSDSVTSGGGLGSSTAGIVFSEYALANPAAWAYYRPILEENNGWATFITTPRGRNHAFALFQHSAHTSGWFSELLTVDDTAALSREALAEALKEYVALYGVDQGESIFRQEFYCDWTSAMLGAFYAREMAQVRAEDRILEIEAEPDQYVHRAWDLGVGDDTSIWWFQAVGSQLLILDHYATSGAGLEHYAGEIESREKKYGWLHGHDLVPHDAKVREWGSGRTRIETMQTLGLKPLLVPLATIDDGINAVRRTLPFCVFHPRTEQSGIGALEQYHREWDEEKKAFRQSAVHDWTSHPADAFRYLSMAWKQAPRREVKVVPPQGFIIPPPLEPRKGLVL
jgi:hypothetical protein